MSDNRKDDFINDVNSETESSKKGKMDLNKLLFDDEDDVVSVQTADEALNQKERPVQMPARRNIRNKKHKKVQLKKRIIKCSLLAIAVLLVVYIAGVVFYSGRLCPRTVVWNINCSGKTVEAAEELIVAEALKYSLEIVSNDGLAEYIHGSDIDLEVDVKGKLDPIFEEQKSGLWFIYLFKPAEYHIEASVTYDKEKLMAKIDELDACDTSKMIEPVDAHVAFDEESQEFYIDEGSAGSIIERDILDKVIIEAVSTLKKSVDLAESGCYKLQTVLADDETLLKKLELVKEHGNIEVTFLFGEEKEVLDIVTISEWLTNSEGDAIEVDSTKVTEYVTKLAEKYDTYNKDRTLHTTYGFDVTVEMGDYGWKMDVAATAAKVANAISTGGVHEFEPEWEQTANAFGEEDWGDTYIEVNITKQHLYYYKEGELVVESDFVSGDVRKGRSTPVGIYSIKYKKSPSILRGINWETPVTYWMPFFDGCGLHDATWRGSFGGTIYYYNGSHGCLNMPYNEVKTIYENITAGAPILLYKTEVEPVEVVPVHETPWPSGYPTEVPTAEPDATEIPVEIVETQAPVVTPSPTPAPVATATPAPEVTATPEPAVDVTAEPNTTEEPQV